MQIYFGFTVAGDRSAVTAARKIVGILEEMRHEVLTRHLVEDNAWEADRSLTPKEVYLRDMKWLEQCDMFIAEVSGSSFGLGFETGYLLGQDAHNDLRHRGSSFPGQFGSDPNPQRGVPRGRTLDQ